MKIMKATKKFKEWYRKWYGLEAKEIRMSDKEEWDLYVKVLTQKNETTQNILG